MLKSAGHLAFLVTDYGAATDDEEDQGIREGNPRWRFDEVARAVELNGIIVDKMVCRADKGGVFPDGHLVVDCGLGHNPLSLEDHG